MPQLPEAATPIRLVTLGPLEVTGLPSQAIERVTAQPKRLALLVYLAARAPGGGVPRDRLLATFWPELPADRAQGNLRNALYFLRRALGPDHIITRGKALAVTNRVQCDAAVLLSNAEPDEAVLLRSYRGEFLDAFHIPGAPDFERWVDRTRAALRARAVELAWRLSEAAEASGQLITAAHYARRAADLSVDIEGATQQLLRLLLRAGDHAAALLEYDRLVARLDLEFNIAPSPETAGLVVPIRTGRSPAGAAARALAPKPALLPARSLAVLPFENLGGEASAYLATGLGDDLRTALARLRDVRIVSRTSVLRFAGRSRASMRPVRELLEVDLVLDGSLELQGDSCRIVVQLRDARTDRRLWTQRYDRARDAIFEVESDVALRVARALGIELSPREHRHLRRPPTSDQRAWQFYLKGREIWSRRNARDLARATELFQRALKMDRRFAPAWVGLADAILARTFTSGGSWQRATLAARQALHRALESDPDLGEARATLGLLHTFFDWDPVAARREYRRAIELSPGYAIGHQWFGNWLCAFGEAEEGLAELTMAVKLDPVSPAVNESLGLGLLHAGKSGEAQARFRQTLEFDPGYWRARIGLAMCGAIRGDLACVATELVQVWQSGGLGANRSEGDRAGRALQRDPRAALECLSQSLKSRRRKGGATRSLEIAILAMQRRDAEAVAALWSSRRQSWLPTLIWYAPVLDPLVRDTRFRDVMQSAGMLLPRWRKEKVPDVPG